MSNLFITCTIILLLSVGLWVILKSNNDPAGDKQIQTPVAQDDFHPLVEMKIGDKLVMASIARTLEERQIGLSNTDQLPHDVVKLFIYDIDSTIGIWMKDMNYPIDIIWVNSTGEVVDMLTSVSPDTYPDVFESEVPARYVIETKSGFAVSHQVKEGTKVTLPAGI